jgi:hypothetical protein
MIRMIATSTDSSVTVPVVRSADVNAKIAGTNRPMRARTRSAALETAILALKVWTPFRNPPTRTAAPITSSRLPMIEPVSEAWTTSIRPRWRGEERDDQLGDVAERRVEDAADLGAGQRPEPLGGEAHDPGETEDGRRREHEQDRLVGVQPEVEDDRGDAQDDRPDEEDARQHRELPRMGRPVRG